MLKAERRLAILGCYPPPFGGVANHVRRLATLLRGRAIPFKVYNAASASENRPEVISVAAQRRHWLVGYAVRTPHTGVYVLSARLEAWLLAVWLRTVRRRRVAIRLRNSELIDWLRDDPKRAALAGYCLRRVNAVVGVSEAVCEAAKKVGVDPRRVHHVPGFLPPIVSQNERDQVTHRVWQFVDGHRPLIAANGRIEQHRGEDLYGLDMMVRLVASLKPAYPEVGLVVCFWDHHPQGDAGLADLQRLARQLGVEQHILFNTASGPFVPVLAQAQCFVRPTNTDGDANSIREALYLGVPAVASDAAVRPSGTRVFPSRKQYCFEAEVRAALEGHDEVRPPPLNYVDPYLDLLHDLVFG